jgi:hypothetical protein
MADHNINKSYYMVIAFIALSATICMMLDYSFAHMLVAEDGPVETISAALYFACFLLILLKGGGPFFISKPYFALLPLIFALRELDFDVRFTGIKIYKVKFYLNQDISLHAKIIAFTVVATIATLLVLMIARESRAFYAELKHHSYIGSGAFLIIVLIAVSKSIDGLGRKLAAFGLAASPAVLRNAPVAEEFLELGIPMIMVLLFWKYFQRNTTGTGGVSP